MMQKEVPMRRCVSCMTSKLQKEMRRISFYNMELKIDYTGREKGRGAYVCNNFECIGNIKKRRAYQRSFKTQLPESMIDEVVQKLLNELHEIV